MRVGLTYNFIAVRVGFVWRVRFLVGARAFQLGPNPVTHELSRSLH